MIADMFALALDNILVTCVLATVVLIVLYQSISPFPKMGPNPFAKDSRRPPAPLELDQKKRDAVLKQGFTRKKVPDNLDAIVIGSGASGLTLAVTLAKVGKKVLVLEQHDQAGGACHTFIEKGFEFDVGVHYIGKVHEKGGLVRFWFDQLTDGQLQWCPMDDVFERVVLGSEEKEYYNMLSGAERWKDEMKRRFPGEEKAIDRFIEICENLGNYITLFTISKLIPKFFAKLVLWLGLGRFLVKDFKYAYMTTQQVVDQLTSNKDLAALLTYLYGDYGKVPAQSSFAFHSLLVNHYIGGGFYPRGGASEIAYHMIPIIERSGGAVLVRANVTEIIVREEGKATGVKVSKTSGDIEVNAPIVVSTVGAINTFQHLLPPEVAEKSEIHRLLTESKLRSGLGCMQMFVGLNGTAEELGVKSQNLWTFRSRDYNKSMEDYFNLPADEAKMADFPLLFVSFPSAKDETHEERYPGKSTAIIVTLSKWEWFAEWEKNRVKNRGEEYKDIKQFFCDKMWEQTLEYFPQLRGKDGYVYMNMGTPLTHNHYLGAPKGEMYGLDHSMARFTDPDIVVNLRPETGIPGLFMAGQDVFSCGVVGAMASGLLTGCAILNRNLFGDIGKLKKRIRF